MWCAATASAGATVLPTRLTQFPNQNPLVIHPSSKIKCNSHSIIGSFLTISKQTISKPTILSIKCSSSSSGLGASDQDLPHQDQDKEQEKVGFWQKWKANSTEMSGKLAKLGLAAVLAYGLFDGVTYTTFFILAFLGYEKSTGKNPAANLQALIGESRTILL